MRAFRLIPNCATGRRLPNCLPLFTCLSLLTLAGCATPPQAPGAPVAPPALPAVDPAELNALLTRADDAFEQQRLLPPDADNAVTLYQQVLRLQPDNEHAFRRLEAIAEQQLTLAATALQRHDAEWAQILVDRARLADPHHPGIAPALARIDAANDADAGSLHIEPTVLRARPAALAAQLARLGSQAKAAGLYAHIRAPSDAAGRWIYQQMSRGPGSGRLRAQIDLGTPALVRLRSP